MSYDSVSYYDSVSSNYYNDSVSCVSSDYYDDSYDTMSSDDSVYGNYVAETRQR